MTLNSICNSPYNRLAAEFESIRQALRICDNLTLSSNITERKTAAYLKAYSFVWAQAEIERFMKDCLENLAREINSLRIRIVDTKLCLIALCKSSHLQSLQNLKGTKMWDRRVEIITLAESTEIIEISIDDIPLDGKTIRPEHFKTIWNVFGFSGSHMPSPRHALALNNLADSRNTVAHGDEVPERFGRTKTAIDISRLIDLSEEIIIHFVTTIEKYMNDKDYER